MTTRRIVSNEKTYLDADSKGASEPSNITPAVPACVLLPQASCLMYSSRCTQQIGHLEAAKLHIRHDHTANW